MLETSDNVIGTTGGSWKCSRLMRTTHQLPKTTHEVPTDVGHLLPSVQRCFLSIRVSLMWSCALITQLCPDSLQPMDRSRPGSAVPGILQARTQGRVATPSSRGSAPRPGIASMSPTMAGGPFTTEPWEKSLMHRFYVLGQIVL